MTTRTKTQYDDLLIDVFKNGHEPLATEIHRNKSFKYINGNQFPNRKTESWKYTDLRNVFKHQFKAGEKLEISDFQRYIYNIPMLNANLLIFINGHYLPEYSRIISPENKVKILPMSEAKKKYSNIFEEHYNTTKISENNKFAAINTAYAYEGAFINIEKNQELEYPIHLLNFTDGNNSKTAAQQRNLIISGANSKAQVIQTYHSLSLNYTFFNIATELILNANSDLDFNLFQGEGIDAFQIQNIFAKQERDSKLTGNIITLCGALVRNDINIQLNGENSNVELNGFYLPDREQHFDNNIHIYHNVPHCESSQLFKGIIDNKAIGIFSGIVYVAKDAQKTNAYQTNNNILLTDYAKAKSKPQLEIYADDVKCSHGSTIGQLNQEALFYLQSRGIGKKAAKILLLNAFANEVFDKIKNEPFSNFVEFLIQKRMKGDSPEGSCSMIEECQGC